MIKLCVRHKHLFKGIVDNDDDDFSVIMSVCRGPGAQGIYSAHGTPSFMHPLWLHNNKGILTVYV